MNGKVQVLRRLKQSLVHTVEDGVAGVELDGGEDGLPGGGGGGHGVRVKFTFGILNRVSDDYEMFQPDNPPDSKSGTTPLQLNSGTAGTDGPQHKVSQSLFRFRF